MSIARHHAEWLSLVEISGPFLSLPVLMRVFPQGLDTTESDLARNTRLAYAEWEDTRHDRAIHTAWIELVLRDVLEFPAEALLRGQALPTGLEARIAEHGETLRPDYALKRAEDTLPALLIAVFPPDQALDTPVAGAPWATPRRRRA